MYVAYDPNDLYNHALEIIFGPSHGHLTSNRIHLITKLVAWMGYIDAYHKVKSGNLKICMPIDQVDKMKAAFYELDCIVIHHRFAAFPQDYIWGYFP